ncbi:MAG: response regulator [Patescibacteria group bacterium]
MEKKKILIIEDDQSLVRLIKQALGENEFEVSLALTADEGLKKAVSQKPAVIVLDVLLPGKNGFKCLEELKANQQSKNIPVIMLSNLGQIEEIKKGHDLGAIDYLVKADFSVDEVAKRIIGVVKNQKK